MWSDERLDDSFAQLRGEMRDLRQDTRDLRAEMHDGFREIRRELFQMKLFMLGSNVTILAAVISLHG